MLLVKNEIWGWRSIDRGHPKKGSERRLATGCQANIIIFRFLVVEIDTYIYLIRFETVLPILSGTELYHSNKRTGMGIDKHGSDCPLIDVLRKNLSSLLKTVPPAQC